MLAPTFPDNEAARLKAIERMDFAGPERDGEPAREQLGERVASVMRASRAW